MPSLGKANGESIIHHMEKEEIIKIDTLKNLVMKNGDSGKHITYLKIDVEGGEIWTLNNWMKSNVLGMVSIKCQYLLTIFGCNSSNQKI